MRPRQNFSLYPRRRNGKTYWYYRCYDVFGNRTSGRSTGETSKAKARLKCEELYKNGQMVTSSNVLFKVYANDFFSKESSWYKRNSKYKTISENYLASTSTTLRAILMPYFGDMKLKEITSEVLEQFQYECFKKYKPSTCQTYMGYLRTIFEQAEIEGFVPRSPMRIVKRVPRSKELKDKFTLTEIGQLISCPKANETMKVFTVIAACTGMRLGEIAGIGPEEIEEDHINLFRQYTRMKYTETKTRVSRCVPLCPELRDYIQYQFKRGFVFAIRTSSFSGHYCDLVKASGIGKGKNVSFHSTRHFFNTYLLSNNVSPVKVGAVMGHTTELTDVQVGYTNFDMHDFSEIVELQRKVFKTLESHFTK